MHVQSHPYSLVNWQRTSNVTDYYDSYFLWYEQKINATTNSLSSTKKEYPSKSNKCLTGIAWSRPESDHHLCYQALAHVRLHRLVKQKPGPCSTLLQISYIYRDLKSALSENCALSGSYAAWSGKSSLKAAQVTNHAKDSDWETLAQRRTIAR